ncbi:MAG: MnmC family methyltransferase [Polyangiales bacterium]
MSHEVITTATGAHAMRDLTTGEVMHPGVGPLVESERLYVTPSRLVQRLAAPGADPLVVLDAGLGAGSNAVAAWRAAETAEAHGVCADARAPTLTSDSEQRDPGGLAALPAGTPKLAHASAGLGRGLEIVSVDRTLAALELAISPEHAAAFGFDAPAVEAARRLLRDGSTAGVRTRWRVRVGDLLAELALEPADSVDVVFWDPYSPRASPAIWNLTAFSALRRVCRAGATVHTYSAATSTRTALLLAGFAVGYGAAVSSKQRHTTVAALDARDLTKPLDRSWLLQLTEAARCWPSDAPPDALAQLQAHPQFQ